ncbi:hypothetical protein [Novosphingobium sp.]|uniref:hypothetical protein n=1 Tax=Novosphingobium sp. TaxID=1874826 RepID=UPI0025D9F580|nr:hypothetical protein [Novosphingobium sp.]
MTAHLTLLVVFYNAIVLATVVLALCKGDEPEQLTSLVIMTGLFADLVNHWLLGAPNFFTINPGHLVLDGWQLIVLMWVALYANRGWPLWVAALQMIVVAGHLSKLFDVAEIRRGYWVMIAVPGYIQLAVVWIGLASHMRRVGRIGPYAAWRPRLSDPPKGVPTDDRRTAGVRTGS